MRLLFSKVSFSKMLNGRSQKSTLDQFLEELENGKFTFSSDSSDSGGQNHSRESLFDPDEDENNEKWIEETHGGPTDAVLSCPGCFTQICYSCTLKSKNKKSERSVFTSKKVEFCTLRDRVFESENKKIKTIAALTNNPAVENISNATEVRDVLCDQCETCVGEFKNGEYILKNVLSS
jgi:hypothetical protein